MNAEARKNGFDWLKGIADGVDSLEKEQGALLESIREVQSIHSVLIQYEIERLEDLYGQDHLLVMEMQENLGRKSDVLARLGIEAERLTMKPPRTGEKDALIHGRVTDAMARGRGGLFVALTDREGNRLEAGEVETEPSGYYSIVVDPERIGKIVGRNKEICLTVMNRKGEVCYRRPLPSELKEGAEIVEDIVLSFAEVYRGRPTKDALREERKEE